MILENTLIKLDYNPAKDLLFVEWPDQNTYSLYEFNHLLEKVLNTVKYYDISYLLIDARQTVDAITEIEYMDAAIKFLEDLSHTRVKKVARLVTDNINRERQIKEISNKTNLSLEFQTFASLEVAQSWLVSK
ncbi:STAS/SEC14 domain-containing protein [Rufibacter roseus]|uniref:STAS/SEC14 domain-containing protein n=1 Tax=Rufibacter roseus TaxID=1567108 RepID=A0ABW2DIQ0_9BACT|nr:STAS/SEC14 domain-containing protein [Rufibacter roseus]